MKILITGSKGFVGRNLINRILDRYETKTYDFNVVNFDECSANISKVDVVIHLASKIDVSESFKNPRELIYNNYVGTLNILEAMRINGISKLIFLSSQGIYGNNINVDEDDTSKISVLEPYSLSKLLSENTIKLYSRVYGINYVIFRPSHLYGSNQSKGIVPLLLNRIMTNSDIEIGNNISRDLLNVDDLIDAITMALDMEGNWVFNLGTGAQTTLMELIEIISKILNKKLNVTINKNLVRNTQSERWSELANINKIKPFGWHPKRELKTWLNENIKIIVK